MSQQVCWQVLSIDAISSVNQMTKKVLEGIHFLGKNISVLKSSSLQHAKTILSEQEEIAVVMLDTTNEGLEESLNFIRLIRVLQKNQKTRIILRAGYPDTLPEIKLIENYDIDGYISKETMHETQLMISVMTAIRAYQQIITTTKVLQSLAGSIAHEMRNSLSQVKYALEAIKSAISIPYTQHPTSLPSRDESQALLQWVHKGLLAINRGEHVIVDVMNEVSNKPIDQQTFRYLTAAETTQKAIDECIEAFNGKDKIFLSVIQDFTFKVSETLFLFVLFNLIKNALYYFKDLPHAILTISIDGHTHSIKVHDTGPGISSDVQSRLFEPFVTSGKDGGTGLGLAYCKRIMKAFDGNITCESVEGKFTEFTLNFPPVLPPMIEHKKQKTQIGDRYNVLSGRTVIVADDDEINREYVIHVLQMGNRNITVLEAQNGEGVLNLLHKKKVDAILMDLKMSPGMGGIEAAKTIRAGLTQPNVPIIALTGKSSSTCIEETTAAGMNDFLEKPVVPELLLEKLIQSISTKNLSTEVV